MLLTFYAFLGLYFLVYSVINLACWFSYEANTKNNFLFPHQILQLTNVLSIYYFMGSDSLISYVDIISLKESERLGMITEDQLHAIEALLPFEEPEEFFDEKYEDISGEFKTAAKELLELVLDSTNMPNGVSLATTKFSLNYLSEDELLWIDPKMHKLVELPSVNLVQSNTYIQVVLDLGTSLIETVYEDYDDRRLDVQQFKEINHFIMKYAHFDLLDPIQHIVSSQLIELLNEADRIHAVSVRAIIVLLCLLTAANSLLLFGFLYHYQKRISNILASYCCLTSKDIVFETGMISSAQQFFNGKLYDHSRMEEAIKIANFDKKDFDDSFEKKPKDKKRDSKNVVRKRKGVNSTDGTEFLMVKYPYRSIVTALLLNLMTLVFSVITVVFILLVEQEKKVASFLTSMSVLNNLKTMNVHENFARFLAFAPSAVMSTNITQHIEYLDISKFEKDSDEFHYFWASARDQLNSVVDPSIGMNELVYRDFCAMVFSYKELYTTGGEEIVLAEDTELIEGCKSGYLWGNQGFNQYILYEESQLREISILTLDALESYEKSGSKEELMQVLSDIWFNDRYVRLRFLHHEAFEFYLFASFMKFNQALKSRSSRGANLMATFAVVTVLLVILPIAVFYQMAVVSLERDHLVSLFTFDMIHPSTTINNQYLKAKFKKYFRLYAVF